MALYKVKQGDCISSIAFSHGMSWDKLWNHPENEALKRERDPNQLKPGDQVFIPPLELRYEKVSTEQRHRFKVKEALAMLHLRLVDAEGAPRADLNYTLNVDGRFKEGTTDEEGCIDEVISPASRKASLMVHLPQENRQDDPDEQVYTGPPLQMEAGAQQSAYIEEYEILLGSVDPAGELVGIQERLVNLGYEQVEPNGQLDESTRNALRHIQQNQNLKVTGELDGVTRRVVVDLHGG